MAASRSEVIGRLSSSARGYRGPRSGAELDLGFDLDRNGERQLEQADGTARVGADLGPEEIDDELAEAVDHRRLADEPRRRVHHAEDPRPGGDAVEGAEGALQAGEDRQRGEPRRRITLLDRQVAAHLAERLRERAVGVQRAV